MLTITDIPFYYHHEGNLTSEPKYTLSADPNDYFQTLQAAQEYIENQFDPDYQKRIEYLIETKEYIQETIDCNYKLIWFQFSSDPDYIKYKKYIDNIPEPFKAEWKEKLKPAISIIKENLKKNDTYIKENKDKIFQYLDSEILKLNPSKEIIKSLGAESILKFQENLKESRKKANKKYYLKRKAMMNLIPKPQRTQEEQKEARKKTNNKYYLKNKVINEDDKVIIKDDIKLKKQEYNKNYYSKKKELLEKCKILLLKEQEQN